MRIAVFLFALLVLPIYACPLEAVADSMAIPVGTIVPKHATPEQFTKKPNPILIRIVNRGEKKVYLQGFKTGNSKKVHFYFYHRNNGRGWKPFFESLPCNHPTCQNLHAIGKLCNKAQPYVVELGSAGQMNSLKEFRWDGLLYQQSESIEKDRKRRYCYQGLIPKDGQIRIEMEYSETFQHDQNNQKTIGTRLHAAIEFEVPPTKTVYEIAIGG